MSCPGVNSDIAGKADGCKGCPNKSICSSQQSNQVNQEQEVIEIANRLKNVKNIILVMSGKGGTGKHIIKLNLKFKFNQMQLIILGKSTLSSNLARSFAEDENLNVGLLDIDICGPSIAHMFGLNDEKIHLSNAGWSPIYVKGRKYI